MIKTEYKKVYNWSKTKSYNTEVLSPTTYEDLKFIIKNNKHKSSFSFKAGGCSYGDCFLNEKGKLVDLINFNKIINLDLENESLVVQCGAKVEDVLNHILPKGYYINSIPGANNATIGGCINSNVHGKDSFNCGVFSNNIISLKVIDSFGEISKINKEDENFFYALGTYGLNFIVLEAKISLNKIPSTMMDVDTKKFHNYNEMISLFLKYEKGGADMLGAWVDHFNNDGRGIFKAASWNKKKKLQSFKKIDFSIGILKRTYINIIYPIIRFFIVNRPIIKICNLVLFKISKPKKQILNYSDFYFPQQKFLPEESKLFDHGKVNIQILMPDKKVEMILKSISLICIKFRMESWWMGIKKHKKNDFIFNFAIDGYDVTLQWSKKYTERPSFAFFYDELMELIIKNDCLIYLTQDILLKKNNFRNIYKNYKVFNTVKNKLDPSLIFRNNLYDRLFK